MKIVAITGSPRKNGNTNTIIKEILRGSESNNHNQAMYYLDEMNILGCKGCRYCKQNDNCMLKDDMELLYNEIKSSDVLILGSSNYMGDITGQTKIFLDRWYALKNKDFTSRINGDKKAIFVFSQGSPNTEYYMSVYTQRAKIIESYGFSIIDILVACGVSKTGDVKNNLDIMNKAFKLGREII